uniref:Uncharacterized protein n=1 Tax=Ditylum brightwellii TaxID=49249 RepID=A0A7S4RIH7_9STRA
MERVEFLTTSFPLPLPCTKDDGDNSNKLSCRRLPMGGKPSPLPENNQNSNTREEEPSNSKSSESNVNNDDGNTLLSSSYVTKSIHYIQTRIDAAHVSLDICNQRRQQQQSPSLLQETKNVKTVEKQEETEEWWSILGTMLQEAISMYCDCNDYILSVKSSSLEQKKEDTSTQPSLDTNQLLPKKEKVQYEYKQTNNIQEEEEEVLWKNKTLIFSGKGIISKTQKLQPKTKSSLNGNAVSPPSPFLHPTNKLSLLRELQNRIDKMEFAEEWDAVVLEEEEEEDNRKSGTKKDNDATLSNGKESHDAVQLPSTTTRMSPRLMEENEEPSNDRVSSSSKRSTPFFLGATGDLLSELKGAMMISSFSENSIEKEEEQHLE